MGKRGAPPTPTALKKLRGNPGRRPLPENEPQPVRAIPDPPLALEGYALDEWHARVPILYRMGVMTEADGTGLALYCAAFGRWQEAELKTKETGGAVIETTNGNIIQNPWLAVAHRAWDQLLKAAKEFGMTPSSRSGIEAIPPSKDDSMEQFLFGDKKSALKVS